MSIVPGIIQTNFKTATILPLADAHVFPPTVYILLKLLFQLVASRFFSIDSFWLTTTWLWYALHAAFLTYVRNGGTLWSLRPKVKSKVGVCGLDISCGLAKWSCQINMKKSQWTDLISQVSWFDETDIDFLWIKSLYLLNIHFIEGSLEVKLPTIWTDEKQSRAEPERRERLEEKESEERRCRCAKR